MSDLFILHARADVPPRHRAKTEFTRTARGSRALVSVVASLLADGYDVAVTAPDGTSFSGRAVARPEMMDPDLGYSPRAECADQVEFRHGTWLVARRIA